jgi:cation diffusion facilitator family transporter
MSDCCEHTAEALVRTNAQRRVLWIVLAINLVVFVAEFGAGLWADSTALQADSLDSLGDALVYGISLVVIAGSLRARAGSAFIKGLIQAAFGLAVLAEVVHKAIVGAEPLAPIMAMAGAGALVANATCFVLLTRHRSDDLNMRSVWLCSRNDVVGNVGVLIVAGLVAVTGWRWPDLVFGAGLALLFLKTAWGVLGEAWPHLRLRTLPAETTLLAPIERASHSETPVLTSVLTCPQCGQANTETMPTNACWYFYQCNGCGAELRPKAGDCCVFCSYGSVPCPPVQMAHSCCA